MLHAFGWLLGWLSFALSGRYRRKLFAHAQQAGFPKSVALASVAEAGKMVTELPRLWLGAPVHLEWEGLQLVETAIGEGKGVLYLTPHLGCFEVTAQLVAQQFGDRLPVTVLYRPARQPALAEVIETARRREGLETAPTTLAGVRQMIKALRRGQAVGLLPDQVPPQGQGVWSPFFGQPAYTMTLAARLIQQTGATPLLVWGERLPRAQGFCIHVQPFPEPLSADLDTAVAQINRAMEALIRQCPQQYLWGYGRYKKPRDAAA